MQIEYRAGQLHDFDFCRRLYFGEREGITPEQEESFRDRWRVSEVRIIGCDGVEAGWLQSRMEDGSLYLVQLFLDPAFQDRGIGTATIKMLLDEAAAAGVPMTLGVVKTNPAKRLYERLWFKIIREDDRKFYMKRET